MIKKIFEKSGKRDNPQEIGIRICFEDSGNYYSLIELMLRQDLFGFDPAIMDIDYEERVFEINEAIRLIGRIEKNTAVIFKSLNNGIELTINYQAVINSPIVLSWRIKTHIITERVCKSVEAVAQINGFICCYIYDYWDEYWQSASFESDYEIFGREHRHLKRVENQWGELVIDTKGNVGKLEVLRNINIMAAPIMYFGKWFFENICSSENLRKNFRHIELPNGVLKVELASSIFGIDRNDQKKFLEVINIERVREIYSVFKNN